MVLVGIKSAVTSRRLITSTVKALMISISRNLLISPRKRFRTSLYSRRSCKSRCGMTSRMDSRIRCSSALSMMPMDSYVERRRRLDKKEKHDLLDLTATSDGICKLIKLVIISINPNSAELYDTGKLQNVIATDRVFIRPQHIDSRRIRVGRLLWQVTCRMAHV